MENWGLQKHESTVPQTGEQRFLQAKSAVKISDCDHERIAEALRLVMVKIGLRAANWPSPMEKVILIDHVVQNFPKNTVEEIKIAFDWAIDGRTGAEVNCYENFSCAYFSGIMKAYNLLAGQVKVEPRASNAFLEDARREYDYGEFLKSEFAGKLRKLGVEIPGDKSE
jgi:hypothetical protein